MSTHLTSGQRALLASQLQLRQAELDHQLAEHQQGVSRVEHAHDLLSQDSRDPRQGDADREVDLARSDRDLLALGQVSQALQRVQQPDYGLCADCGEAIAFDRLKLEPWALRCVACASRAEGPATARHTL